MADHQLESLLAEAQKAYRKQDKHTGAQRIDEILKQDFNHPGAWQLLYRLYGAKQPFEDFRRAFAEQYYPGSERLLRPITAAGSAAPPKKPSLFARLFGRFSRKKAQEQPAERAAPTPAPATKEPARPLEEQAPAAEARPETAEKRPGKLSLLHSARPRGETAGRPAASPQISRPAPLPIMRQPDQAPLPAPAAPAPGRKITVIVVDDISETRENIVRSLRFQEEIEVVGKASNGEQGIRLAIEHKPDVILMDVNMPDMDGIAATQAIRRSVPHSQVVILTVQDDVDYIRRAMMAGARDYLTKPPMIDELVAAVQRAGEVAFQEKSKAPPPAPVVQAPQGFISRGKIISVYSPRGGSGCTMLAANLAAALHKAESPVVLVDGNLQFGDVPVFYNVQSRNTVLDLALRADELDAELVESVLIQHSSGIKLLAPPRPEQAENVSGAQFSKVLTYLSEQYAYVIVDTAHRLADVTLAALDHSDLIVLITTQDVPSIARTRKFLDLVPLLNLDPQKILSVMNRFDKRGGITPEKVEQAFKLKIAVALPLDNDTIMQSINRGAPILLEKEGASRPIAQAILEIAASIQQQIAQLEQAAASD